MAPKKKLEGRLFFRMAQSSKWSKISFDYFLKWKYFIQIKYERRSFDGWCRKKSTQLNLKIIMFFLVYLIIENENYDLCLIMYHEKKNRVIYTVSVTEMFFILVDLK